MILREINTLTILCQIYYMTNVIKHITMQATYE